MRLVPFALLGLSIALSRPSTAEACALMPVGDAAPPNLSVERVLILYDEAQRLEHFVREVSFDGASGTFAFVVPKPARPELAVVDPQPFDALAAQFPIDRPPEPEGGFVGGAKSAMPERAAAVQVLSTQQIGKFKAFVLAASDAPALSRWLTDERITLPAGGQEWLSHYVKLRFYFAAFRYDAPAPPTATAPAPPPSSGFATPPGAEAAPPPPPPPPAAPAGSTAMTSETVRLTFSTPVPYFPYLEPVHAGKRRSDAPHEMQVWLVSAEMREPRLRRAAGAHPTRWAWAWQAGEAYHRPGPEVALPLGVLRPLVPKRDELIVQTFRDTRQNRDGWGDIVFPPAESQLDEPGWLRTAAFLLGDLDRLIHRGALEPSELGDEESLRVAPSARGCACSMAGDADAHAAWMIAAAGLALARRRRGRVR
jgi:MYXO-CTERM domain-containing protein